MLGGGITIHEVEYGNTIESLLENKALFRLEESI